MNALSLQSVFDELLSNIEPDPRAKRYAQRAHEPLREYLSLDKDFGAYFVNSFLYGSYARHTAVGEIKDVDLIILTSFDHLNPRNVPRNVLSRLKAALDRYYKDADNQDFQKRSIRINDPLPEAPNCTMSMDVVPAVPPNGEENPVLVPDRELGQWIPSNPKGHMAHTSYLNSPSYGKGRFVPLVKLIKWWWKWQVDSKLPKNTRVNPKGFWLECLVGQFFRPAESDWPIPFIDVLERISEAYSETNNAPTLHDPGLPGQTIETGMTGAEFTQFMRILGESLILAKQAQRSWESGDTKRGREQWVAIFGDKFPGGEASAASPAVPLLVLDENHVQRPPWPTDRRVKIGIDAEVYDGNKKRQLSGLNSDGRSIDSGLSLKFTCSMPRIRGPYAVHWQVTNTGTEAKQANDLRGSIFLADGLHPTIRWETSRYRGRHWIQCFVVENEVCIGRSDRFYVNIA